MAKKKSRGFTSEQGELMKALYGNKKLVQPIGGQNAQEDLFSNIPEPEVEKLPSQEFSADSQARSVKDILKNKVTAEKVASGFVDALISKNPEMTRDQAKKEIKDALLHTVETGEFVDIFGTGMTPATFLKEIDGPEFEGSPQKTQREIDVANEHISKMKDMLSDSEPTSQRPNKPKHR